MAAIEPRLVRLQRLLYDKYDTYKPADWGDELLNLAYMTRAYEVQTRVQHSPSVVTTETATVVWLREGGTGVERRYLCTLADIEEGTSGA